jgi:hypothetical protein
MKISPRLQIMWTLGSYRFQPRDDLQSWRSFNFLRLYTLKSLNDQSNDLYVHLVNDLRLLNYA